ncbi:NAD(+)--arginine ADP-ribosyltransferase EFV [Enterobacterales bacterium 8AC]|nr:NAD(+)--arginine ADP-ribosyltransferase EFV [Enterobacterales bacterium 8AC]
MGDVISGSYDGSNDSVIEIMDAMDRYADLIDGWANTVARKMFDAVDLQDAAAWRQRSQLMSAGLRDIVNNTPVGQVARNILDEQVKLIKSLPIEAADRVYDIHNQAIEAVVSGRRSTDLTAEIMRSGEVAESRARLIARTEVGKASTALTEARSTAIGSKGYIWRTAHDGDARHSHSKMEGEFVYWSHPPTLDGMTGHAGTLPNCRCYPEVVFPDVDLIESPPSR